MQLKTFYDITGDESQNQGWYDKLLNDTKKKGINILTFPHPQWCPGMLGFLRSVAASPMSVNMYHSPKNGQHSHSHWKYSITVSTCT